jgi:hypothetical protein
VDKFLILRQNPKEDVFERSISECQTSILEGLSAVLSKIVISGNPSTVS